MQSDVFIAYKKVYFNYPSETYIGWNEGNQSLDVYVGGNIKASWDNN